MRLSDPGPCAGGMTRPADTHGANCSLMSVDQPRLELDQRQEWARVRAAVACLTGVAVIALSASMLALIVIAGIARFWTWIRDRDIESAAVLGIASETALASGLIALVACWDPSARPLAPARVGNAAACGRTRRCRGGEVRAQSRLARCVSSGHEPPMSRQVSRYLRITSSGSGPGSPSTPRALAPTTSSPSHDGRLRSCNERNRERQRG